MTTEDKKEKIEQPSNLFMKITLRTATEVDKAFCQQVHHEAYQDVVTRQFGEWNEEKSDWFFEQRWASLQCEVVLLDGIPVGCFSRQLNADHISIDEVEVLPAYQNHGIGTELVRRLQEVAMKLGVPVRLRVLKENIAQQLYKRLGFVVTGETDTHKLMEWTTQQNIRETQ